jgi:hypothetical protein
MSPVWRAAGKKPAPTTLFHAVPKEMVSETLHVPHKAEIALWEPRYSNKMLLETNPVWIFSVLIHGLLSLISGFRSDVDEICAHVGYYVASCGNCFGTNHRSQLQGGPIRCPETPVNNYHTTLRNVPEECRSHGILCFQQLSNCISIWSIMTLLCTDGWITTWR